MQLDPGTRTPRRRWPQFDDPVIGKKCTIYVDTTLPMFALFSNPYG